MVFGLFHLGDAIPLIFPKASGLIHYNFLICNKIQNVTKEDNIVWLFRVSIGKMNGSRIINVSQAK